MLLINDFVGYFHLFVVALQAVVGDRSNVESAEERMRRLMEEIVLIFVDIATIEKNVIINVDLLVAHIKFIRQRNFMIDDY